jgi:cell division protein FtsQ
VITGLRHAPALAVLRSHQRPVGGRSRDPFVLVALAVLGDAPAPLRARVVAITVTHGALTIHLHRGPRLIFGSASLPHAKWDAAAAVLADASSRGASYVDVQLPSRPAAQVADPATASTASAAMGALPSSSASVATVVAGPLLPLVRPSAST